MSLSEWSFELFIFKPLWLVYMEYEYDGNLFYIFPDPGNHSSLRPSFKRLIIRKLNSVPLSMLDFIYRKDHLFSVATGKFYHSKED